MPLPGAKVVLAVLALSPALVACGSGGFQPLYGTTASGQQMTDVLANLEVSPIPGRVGQRVRNDLIFYRGGGATRETVASEYRLDIAIREYAQSVLVTTSGLATSQIYSVDAAFKIVRIKDAKVMMTGNAYARAPYDVNSTGDPSDAAVRSDGRSVFANVRAQHDAQNRAATSLASDIRTRVAAFLSGNS
jgi:LPS-assembly lipoprotein